MNENNIHVLALPSHTTHCLQPLDDIPFANFKMAWYEGLRQYVRKSGAKKLFKAEFFEVFSPAWLKAGFRNTVVWPIDRQAISDAKIGPSIEAAENLGSKNVY